MLTLKIFSWAASVFLIICSGIKGGSANLLFLDKIKSEAKSRLNECKTFSTVN